MAIELDATQGEPGGVTAAIPGNETAPEQEANEQDTGSVEADASEEGAANEAAQGDGENGEATAEDGTAKPKPDKLPWYQRRINEETNKRRELERRLHELEAKSKSPASSEGDTSSHEASRDIDSLVDQRAEEKLRQQEFNRRVSSWDSAGAQEFGREAFNQSCNLVAGLLDQRETSAFMDSLTDPEVIPDGHKVIVELANDPEEAERIMRLPPLKRTVALLKISERISQPTKPTPKPISKAPAPVSPVGGTPKPGSAIDNPDAPQEDFARDLYKMLNSKKR